MPQTSVTDAAVSAHLRMKKKLLIAWAMLGIYFVIAVAGGGKAGCAAIAMFCGFMMARNMADVVQPNAAITGEVVRWMPFSRR